jgi:uncharacterized protein YkwD
MRIVFPALALLALSLGGCSSDPDVSPTGAFGGAPRPQASISGNDEFMQAAPRRQLRRVRPSEAQVTRIATMPAMDASEPDSISDEAQSDVLPVTRRTVIEPIEPAPSLKASTSRGRFNPSGARSDINAYREQEGLQPLAMDPDLMQAAKAQSDAMARADSMDHSVGGSFASRMSRVGIEDVPAAENIAAGYANASAVIRGWQASEAHDANLKMRDATRMGIAATPSPSQPEKLYWTLIVAGQ